MQWCLLMLMLSQVTNPIPRTVRAPIREVAASMPIAIPFPQQAITDFRDAGNRRGSNSGRKATFQIGHVRKNRDLLSLICMKPL